MQGQDFSDLVDDIRRHNLREKIVTLDGQVLDGRNRMLACEEAGIEPEYEPFTGDDPTAYVISLNLHRRHLNASQRAMIAAALESMEHGGDRKSDQDAKLHLDRASAAKTLNVSSRSVADAAMALKHGTPGLVDMVKSGEVPVSTAAIVARLLEPEQAQAVAKGKAGVARAAKRLRAESATRLKAASPVPNVVTKMPGMPGKYNVIVIDPPWPGDVPRNGVGLDYPTMTVDELAAFGVSGMAAEDCHLFCWATQEYLPQALRLVEVWGFVYVLCMVWHKPDGLQPADLPQYNCEFIVYARQGSPQFVDTAALQCVFSADAPEEGRTPDAFYEMIRRVTDGTTRIDVFGGKMREGFERLDPEDTDFSSDGSSALTSEALLEIQPTPESV